MSSRRIKRRTALLGCLALSACGFAPVYRNSGALRGMIAFDTPDSVPGFRLREQLERRLGLPQTASYALQVTLRANPRPAAINVSGDTTRVNVIGTADWVLTDRRTGTVAGSGQVETFTSYAATGSTVATQSAEEDAMARLSVALADMIVSRLHILSEELLR